MNTNQCGLHECVRDNTVHEHVQRNCDNKRHVFQQFCCFLLMFTCSHAHEQNLNRSSKLHEAIEQSLPEEGQQQIEKGQEEG